MQEVSIKPVKYVHFEGNEFVVTGTATHSQTQEELVIYHALEKAENYACPVSIWNEIVELDGRKVKRFFHKDDMTT